MDYKEAISKHLVGFLQLMHKIKFNTGVKSKKIKVEVNVPVELHNFFKDLGISPEHAFGQMFTEQLYVYLQNTVNMVKPEESKAETPVTNQAELLGQLGNIGAELNGPLLETLKELQEQLNTIQGIKK